MKKTLLYLLLFLVSFAGSGQRSNTSLVRFPYNSALINGAAFTPVPISYSDLSTAGDGLYILTDGNNPGLVVSKEDGEVNSWGTIASATASVGDIEVDAQVAATSGTFNVLDGATVLNSVPIAWDETTDSPSDIAGFIAAAIDLSGYSSTANSAIASVSNASGANGGVISIATVTGDDLVTVAINDFAGGSTYSLRVDYNYALDAISVYYDGNGNSVNPLVAAFPYNNPLFNNNDLSQDGGSDFSSHALTSFSNNQITGGGSIVPSGSDADVTDNIIHRCTVDFRLLTSAEEFKNNNISLNKATTFTPAGVSKNLQVNPLNSNYDGGTLTLTAEAIDFQESIEKAWAGIYTVSSTASLLKNAANFSTLPKYFKLKNFKMDWTLTTTALRVSQSVQEWWGSAFGDTIIDLSTDPDWYADCVNMGTYIAIVQVNIL